MYELFPPTLMRLNVRVNTLEVNKKQNKKVPPRKSGKVTRQKTHELIKLN